MFVVLILNSGVIIALSILDESDPNFAWLELVDNIILGFYVKECIIKIVGLGIEKYFEDSWNNFDFMMALISIISLAASSFIGALRDAKNIKAGKLLRLTKINRVFKMFKALRSVKVMNAIMIGADALNEM